MTNRNGLLGLLAALATASCAKGMSEAEVGKIVDERVAAALAKHAPASAPTASERDAGTDGGRPKDGARPGAKEGRGGSEPPHAPSAELLASVAFLEKADELMEKFLPVLPPEEDHSDLLACVTSQTEKQDVALAKGADRLRARDRSSRQRIEEVARRFADRLPLHYRIDLDAKERKSPGGKTFLYSETDVPEEPALMRLLAKASVAVPERLSCRVKDYRPGGEGDKSWTVTCSVPAHLRVAVRGTPPELHATDEVSVPIATVSRDPSGVLVKTGFERWSGHPRGTTWVAYADAPALVVKPATCPTASQLLEAAEADAGR